MGDLFLASYLLRHWVSEGGFSSGEEGMSQGNAKVALTNRVHVSCTSFSNSKRFILLLVTTDCRRERNKIILLKLYRAKESCKLFATCVNLPDQARTQKLISREKGSECEIYIKWNSVNNDIEKNLFFGGGGGPLRTSL